MKNTLVAYFSASGVTRNVAKALAKITGADLYEICPETHYTDADLNWNNKNSRSSKEMQDKSSRPALADTNAGVENYDTIFLGFPIWWYTAPMVVRTFLEAYDFSGKTIVLFATSGGSGFGRTVDDLKDSISPSAVIREGKVFRSQVSESELEKWIYTIKL